MKSNLTTLRWLLRRELWEHKGMVLWAPAVVTALVLALVLGALLMGHNLTTVENMLAPGARQEFARAAPQIYIAIGMPLYLELGFLVFFYCLGALHDDRRDRSVLFWKSLPIPDHLTVLSKVAVALLVTPVVTLLAATALSIVVMLLVCTAAAFQGVNLFGALLGSSEFYLAPLRLFGLLPVYMLWALPTIGWLLLVSSWARSKVFLWAVGVPLGCAVLVTWANKIFALGWNIGWFMENIVARMLAGVTPGAWFAFAGVHPNSLLANSGDKLAAADHLFVGSWATLASPALWAGVVAGVAMLAGAVWMRRWREEG